MRRVDDATGVSDDAPDEMIGSDDQESAGCFSVRGAR
jgi:hypothetical protein